jgi:hypothetical protein
MIKLPGITLSPFLNPGRYALIVAILSLFLELEVVQASHGDPLAQTDGPNQVVFLNADALRLANAEGQMRVFAQAREQLRHKDQGRYQEVNHKYRVARRLYHKYQRLAQITETKIQTFMSQSPELYQYLNHITTEAGNKVYAYIGTKDRFSSEESTGMTHISYSRRAADSAPVLLLSEESEQGVLLLHPQENAIKITLAADGDLTDTRHELGHFEVAVTESQSYYEYLSQLSAREMAHYDGHHFDDRSGQKAKHYEH